jgi:hypothetical protein
MKSAVEIMAIIEKIEAKTLCKILDMKLRIQSLSIEQQEGWKKVLDVYEIELKTIRELLQELNSKRG